MPRWKQLYDAAAAEMNLTERRRLITETQMAIVDRLKEISDDPRLADERVELDNAATTVNILQRAALSHLDFDSGECCC